MAPRNPFADSSEGTTPNRRTGGTPINFDLEVSQLQQRHTTFSPPPPPPIYGARQPRPASRPTAPASLITPPPSAPAENQHFPVIRMPVPKTPEQTSPVSPLLQYQETGGPPPPAMSTYSQAPPYAYPEYAPPPSHDQSYRTPGYFAYDAYDPPPEAYYAPASYHPADDEANADVANRSYDGMADDFYDHNGEDYAYSAAIDEEALREYNLEDEQVEKMVAEYNDEKMRYGAPPEEPTARRGTKLKKKFVLTDGNLVVDLPIPSNLRLGMNAWEAMKEMKSVRSVGIACADS